ncbi:FG-GAP repeat domain-containing protein [Streptomyces sp. NPDC058739]|uniref:FG-GAP repeat domain-containing protein n=1 Tax=Streptomyces sp. NPDC058739 TaxID=3346618 RepID=UPI0036B0B2F1
MGRHALRRGGQAAAVCSLVVAVAASSLLVLSSEDGEAAETAAGTTGITLTDPSTTAARTERPYVVGDSGFLHRHAGKDGLLWTDYATGRTVTVGEASGVYTPDTACATVDSACRDAWYGSDGDTVALPRTASDAQATLWDPATGTTRTVEWNAEDHGYYRALAGDTILTTSALLDEVDGAWRTRPVGGESTSVRSTDVRAADSSGVLVADGNYGLAYIDVETAVATTAFTDTSYIPKTVMNEDRVGWYDTYSGSLHLKSRKDLAAPEQQVEVPELSGGLDGEPVLVGDWVLLPRYVSKTVTKLLAVNLTDPTVKQTLLASVGEYALAGGDGEALVSGGTALTDRWVQRVTQAEDGTLKLEKLYRSPALENAKTGIALSRGSLRVAEDDPASTTTDTSSVRTLSTNGSTVLTASAATESGAMYEPVCPYPGTTCSALWGGLDGEDVYLDTNGGTDEGENGGDDRLRALGGHYLDYGTRGGAIVDVSDDYAVYNSGGVTPTQYVGRLGYGQLVKRSVRAAALNGPTLWSPGTLGKLTSYGLVEMKTLATVTVPGLACVPSELQAAGRWVYWACGTASAGVYDTKAGTARAVAPGDVLLGDGFTVRHDHAADELVLTEAATGATRVIASGLPDSGLPVDRRYRWTVDEYTGLVAWFDDYERTQVVTTGIAPSATTAFRAETESYAQPSNAAPWTGEWLLSRPVSSWSLAFTSVQSGANGKATRTLTGGATAAHVSARWNGLATNGLRFPNGWATWTLRATGVGSTAANTVTTGTVFFQWGMPVRRDFVSPDGTDGRGDLLTLTTSGALTLHAGTGTGRVGERTTATGWPSTVTAVPFGDLSGDRCNDVLVRLSSGALRLYKPGCNTAPRTSTPYTTLATGGWTAFDVLTSPGDVSGDGLPDVIARKASTGAVYLYKGLSTGKLSTAVLLYSDWRTYKKVVGVGDITGDGRVDLIAQDKTNALYRYDGRGNGTFGARVKLSAGWGGAYNVVVGVGDLTDDGNADLVARDTGGTLWRHSGTGRGTFAAGVKLGTGWSGYKSLS